MIFNPFVGAIILRLFFIALTMYVFVYVLHLGKMHATIVFLFLLKSTLFVELIYFISRSNRELLLFLNAVKNADFSQNFQFKSKSRRFDEFSKLYQTILNKHQADRIQAEESLLRMKLFIELAPVPLMSVHEEGRIELLNARARQYFCDFSLKHVRDLARYGQAFSEGIQALPTGDSCFLNIEVGSVVRRVNVFAIQVVHKHSREKLFSLIDIQSELEQIQLDAWQDLVKVLTHEIMNSVTPISSIARSSMALVDASRAELATIQDEKALLNSVPSAQPSIEHISGYLDDMAESVKTLSNRSDALTIFLKSYAKLTYLPTPAKQKVSVSALFERVSLFFKQSIDVKNLSVNIEVIPSKLNLYIDAYMIEQVLLNLLKNASHAIVEQDHPKITMRGYINIHGKSVIEVSDNGSGIPEDIKSKIFIPFYTTKMGGSGIGLSLSKQIMHAHGGNIILANTEHTTFMLIFNEV